VAVGEGAVRSPLPARSSTCASRPATGEQGPALLVLEAMKMEHTLTAPADGTVKSVRYAVGEQVAEGAELVEFEEG
jgi:3-methylcrotonyl-CoA carboxylase alpha subunit